MGIIHRILYYSPGLVCFVYRLSGWQPDYLTGKIQKIMHNYSSGIYIYRKSSQMKRKFSKKS